MIKFGLILENFKKIDPILPLLNAIIATASYFLKKSIKKHPLPLSTN